MIISNATPLITFARIGRLDLLQEMVKQLVIPVAVEQEISGYRPTIYGTIDLAKEDWITVKTVVSPKQVQLLLPTLDQGEAEVIALALEQKARLVLIDELAGRQVAQSLGLPITGSVGVLIQAKQTGKIQAIKPFVDKMTQQGIYFSARFIAQVLKSVGE
ncbi:DUF3368 domain-containing protein [Anaerolineales bacterium HSG25]|nr:DUF3368 domain-containing protein [Anaerolineales bacterium HSG25]